MKNIQVIDGALNSIFEIYQIPDEIFRLMFPKGTDVAFLNDVEKILHKRKGNKIWNVVYKRRVDKKSVIGIHGTLFYDNDVKKYFPTLKEAEVDQH